MEPLQKGYKVTRHTYSGRILGDTVVYTNKEAALYEFARRQAEASRHARSEEAPEVKFEEVTYLTLDVTRCAVGRILHDLNPVTKEALLRADALAKLTPVEREVLGLVAARSDPVCARS